MPRSNPTLIENVSSVQASGSTPWFSTGGYLNSLEAVLGSGTATVDIYVSNSKVGLGRRIASLQISAGEPTEAFSLHGGDAAWHFVRAEVSALSVGGSVRTVAASIGE